MNFKTICFFMIIPFISLFSTECPVHVNEAQPELQAMPESSVETCFNEFISKGGTIIRLEGDVKPFQLSPNDIVFPACSGGNNRSQTLWNLLRPYADKITLNKPHATQYGFDPFNGKANWNRANPQKHDEFVLWAGVLKSPKLGWDVFASWLNKTDATPEEMNKMTEYYNEHYYHIDNLNGFRRVYITFAKNAHIHMYRLNQTNESLENVIVLFFPIEDLIKNPLPEWNTYHGSKKAYQELAKKISAYLDLTQVTK